jgi:hypothetical protein
MNFIYEENGRYTIGLVIYTGPFGNIADILDASR